MTAYNGTVASITLRAALGRKRAGLLALPPLILIGTSAALRLSHPALASWPATILGQLGFSVILPLTALIIGTSVLGAEIDDGSIVTVLATPVRRSSVIVTKFAVASAATIVFAAVPELVAGLIATGGATRLAVGLFAGAVAAAVIYSALFVALSAASSRALAAGLFYVLLWEGVLANTVGGARMLSAGHYGLAVANAVAHDAGLAPGMGLATAIVLGLVVIAAALAAATRKLSSFSFRGDPA